MNLLKAFIVGYNGGLSGYIKAVEREKRLEIQEREIALKERKLALKAGGV